MRKIRFAGVALAMVLCLMVGAFAASNNQTISAMLNRDITITYNGEAQSFQDVKGNPVYPITYNGTTYLPVRGVSDLLGVAVEWDQAANTVRLGSNEKQPTYLVDRPHDKLTSRVWIINDPEMLKFSGDSGVQEFKNGMVSSIWNGDGSVNNSSKVFFDVAGYNQLTFTVAYDKPCTVLIFDQDDNLLSKFDFDGGITTKTINLGGAKRVALCGNGRANTETSFGDHGQVFFYEPTLS